MFEICFLGGLLLASFLSLASDGESCIAEEDEPETRRRASQKEKPRSRHGQRMSKRGITARRGAGRLAVEKNGHS